MLTRRRLVLSLLASAITVLVAAPPAAALVECGGLPNCQSLVGPYVVVPVQGLREATAHWTAPRCPDDRRYVGSDWNGQNPGALSVYIQQGSNTPIYSTGTYTNADATFLAVNGTRDPLWFQPLIGCQGVAFQMSRLSRAEPAGRQRIRRVKAKRLRPGRQATFFHRCRAGERLVHSGAGVGFFDRPPSGRDMRQADTTHSRRRGRVKVRVRTGPSVGDDERVVLQIHAVCLG